MSNILSNSTSLAGEFSVLSQLALEGYDANMTLGNTKNVDILVSDPKRKRMYQLEVKSSLKADPVKGQHSKIFGRTLSWIMKSKHEHLVSKNHYYCFVAIQKKSRKGIRIVRYFVVPSKVVASFVYRSHRYWMTQDPKHKNTTMRLFLIGLDQDQKKYEISTPLVKRYENNWNFKS